MVSTLLIPTVGQHDTLSNRMPNDGTSSRTVDIRTAPHTASFLSTPCFSSLLESESEVAMSGVVVQNMSFKVGQTLMATGVPTAESTNFAVNIGHSPQEIALHFNPRFDAHGDQRTIVCNSYQGGNWGEEKRSGCFPFNLNEQFQIKITFTTEEFNVTLSDGSEIKIPNRPGAEKYKYMHFDGDLRIHGIEIK